MTTTNKGLTIPGLETVYDALAAAIDQAGTEKTELFLVKLALLNANALGHPERFQQHLQAALQDL
jgi:sulfur relay (sulfurtransferase) complex TusBCD TusD component (DsrE family)